MKKIIEMRNGFTIKSEQGEKEVELREGCGDQPTGIALLVDGICVAHFTDFGEILKLDVYPYAAHVAVIRWVDVGTGRKVDSF